jgi:FKBP-type peptidyl-prolyl cis-trans isomerase FklB
MTGIKWVLLLSLCGFGMQAQAQQTLTQEQEQANAANKERALSGGKVSPRQRAELDRASRAEASAALGADFLASNKAKPGVISLASGVQYKILKTGTGKRPTEAGSVRCSYLGTLADGSQFDQDQGKTPAVMRVAGFVPGLKQAVLLMPAGSKWEVVVPPELGAGAQGGHGIPPNSVLVYVIEILGIL